MGRKDVKEAVQNKRNVSRFKGLGELSPNQLKQCLVDKTTRKLIPITFTSDLKSLMNLFSDASEKRVLLEEASNE